jgi:hypothetical protein
VIRVFKWTLNRRSTRANAQKSSNSIHGRTLRSRARAPVSRRAPWICRAPRNRTFFNASHDTSGTMQLQIACRARSQVHDVCDLTSGDASVPPAVLQAFEVRESLLA